MKIKKRPKVGDRIRYNLRYGSWPAVVLARLGKGMSRVRNDLHERREHEVHDSEVCYINDELTGNEPDED